MTSPGPQTDVRRGTLELPATAEAEMGYVYLPCVDDVPWGGTISHRALPQLFELDVDAALALRGIETFGGRHEHLDAQLSGDGFRSGTLAADVIVDAFAWTVRFVPPELAGDEMVVVVDNRTDDDDEATASFRFLVDDALHMTALVLASAQVTEPFRDAVRWSSQV